MTCPGSYAAVQDAQRSGSSVYAAQGTVAHKLAERVLGGELANPRAALGEFHWCDGNEIVIDDEMVEVVQVYVTEVRHREGPHSIVEHEMRVDLASWFKVPPPTRMFGTADTLIFNPATFTLTVVDFKYGSGIYVAVDDNPQLLFYAAGALALLLAEKKRVDTVEIVVVQPRARGSHPVRISTIDVLDLLQWIALELVPAVDRTRDPDAHLQPGEHCRFCDAKPTCAALADRAQAAARNDFPDA